MSIFNFLTQLKRKNSLQIPLGNDLPENGGFTGTLPRAVDPLEGMALHEILRGGVHSNASNSLPQSNGQSSMNRLNEVAQEAAPAQSPEPKRFDSELGPPPPVPTLRTEQKPTAPVEEPTPSLYSRTKALGPAPVYDNKDTNGALKSGGRKALDAFLTSGNPLALAFGFLSGATTDKTYDERKDYRKKAASYDAQYERAFTQDKAEADAYFKQQGLRNDNRNYQLNRDKFVTEQSNKTADNARADEQLAHSIVTAASKRQGGKLLEPERLILERIYKQPIGETVPAEIANRLLQLETSQGNVYGVADINSTDPARVLTGPNGLPAKVKKGTPLVQVSVGEAGQNKVVEYESNNPEPSEEDFDDEARLEVAQEWMNKGFFKAPDAKSAAQGLKGVDFFEKQVEAAKKKKFSTAHKNWRQNRSKAENEGRKEATNSKTSSKGSAKIPASEAAKKYNFK